MEREREIEREFTTKKERKTEWESEREREEWASYLSTYLEHLFLEKVVVYFLYRQLYNYTTSCSNFNIDYTVLTFKYQRYINFDDEKKQSNKTTRQIERGR